MKRIGIKNECGEDWSKMTPTMKGAFCQLCSKNVHDLTGYNHHNLISFIRQNSDESTCVKMTESQVIRLTREFNEWSSSSKNNVQRAMLFSLVVVFGLTLFSCSSEKDEKALRGFQAFATEMTSTEERELNLIDRLAVLEQLELEDVEYAVDTYRDLIEDKSCAAHGLEYKNEKEKPLVRVESIESVTMGQMISTVEVKDFVEVISIAKPDERFTELESELEFKSKLFPNPMSSNGTLEFEAPEAIDVNIQIFSVSGKHVGSLHEGVIHKGIHQFNVNLLGQMPGTYLILIKSAAYSETIRLVKV